MQHNLGKQNTLQSRDPDLLKIVFAFTSDEPEITIQQQLAEPD